MAPSEAAGALRAERLLEDCCHECHDSWSLTGAVAGDVERLDAVLGDPCAERIGSFDRIAVERNNQARLAVLTTETCG
jgi:hypothetical protein